MKLKSNLFTSSELEHYYGIPIWNDTECNEYFTLSPDEIKQLRRLAPDSGLYFIIVLAFFKIKKTLIRFDFNDIALYAEHINERYFNGELDMQQLTLPTIKTRTRIENNILGSHENCHESA